MNQTNLALLAPMTFEIREIDSRLVGQCKTYKQAVALCMSQAKTPYTRERWAYMLDMSKGTLNTILDGERREDKRKRNLDPSLFSEIQRIAGNQAINQWFQMELRGELDHQRSKAKDIEAARALLASEGLI